MLGALWLSGDGLASSRERAAANNPDPARSRVSTSMANMKCLRDTRGPKGTFSHRFCNPGAIAATSPNLNSMVMVPHSTYCTFTSNHAAVRFFARHDIEWIARELACNRVKRTHP